MPRDFMVDVFFFEDGYDIFLSQEKVGGWMGEEKGYRNVKEQKYYEHFVNFGAKKKSREIRLPIETKGRR